MSSSPPRTSSIPDRKTALRIMLYVFLVLLMSNLGALVERVAHPDIPYFDEEHLVVGGISGITMILLLGALEIYLARRKQVEAKLNESNERLQKAEAEISKSLLMLESIVSTNPDVIFSLDRNVNLIVWNRALEVATGLAAEGLKNRPALELFVEEDRPAVHRSIQKCLEKGEGEVEARLLNAHGGSTLFHIKGVLMKEEDGSVVGITGSGRDITERKRSEEHVARLHRQNELILCSTAEGILGLDKLGNHTFVNPAAARMLGYEAEELLGRPSHGIWHHTKPDGSPYPEEECRIYTTYRNGIVHRESAEVFWSKDGTSFPVEYVSTPIYEQGGVAGAVLSFTDITDRKQAEEKLQETTQRLLLATTSGGIGVWDLDLRSNVLIWDDRMFELYGVSKDTFPNGFDAWGKCLHPEDYAAATEAVQAAIRGEREFDTEFRVIHPGGKVKFLQANGIVLRNADGKAIRMIGVNRDISERRNLEHQFRQSQKMEAIGRLAGGIAHDFNNLLTVILGYSDLLLDKVKDDPVPARDVEEIKRAGERAAALTRQLLAFSRRQVLQPEVLDLKEVISHMGNMLRRLIGEDVEFRTILGEDLWKVKADPGQIEQVVMNLAVNARDAMPGGGKLTIETSNVFLDKEYSHVHTPEPYVVLAISDTGVGMDEKTASQVFEPFFTTKERGKGTGLGLSTAYGIVKQSGGFILVDSEPGRGSTFKVYLPRTVELKDVPGKEVAPVGDLRGGKTILLVEDEESLRKLADVILGMYGFAVLSAGDGEEGLRIAGEHQGEISLLLTDVVMPKMGGPELYVRLRKLRPGVKVLFMSGYTDDMIVHQGVLEPGIAFLQKPYSPISLVRKVKDVLEER